MPELKLAVLRRRAEAMPGVVLAAVNQANDALDACERAANDLKAETEKVERLHRAAKGAMVALAQMLADNEINTNDRPGLPDLVEELREAIADCEVPDRNAEIAQDRERARKLGYEIPRFREEECGGVVDASGTVHSDADPGL